jgi:micrococcal nuclease
MKQAVWWGGALLALALVGAAGTAPVRAEGEAEVVSVVDGDTLRVRVGGAVEKVRLVGVDAPETGHLRPAEPFHEEATAFVRRLATHARLRLAPDRLQDDRDRYGRLLRYAWLPDGRLLNAEIIRAGWAEAYRRLRYERRAEFLRLEREARDARRGRWAR